MSSLLKCLSAKNFIEDCASSFGYYSLLPTDNFELSADWPDVNLLEIATCLIGERNIVESQVDALTLALLLRRNEPLPTGVNWVDLADRLCVLFSSLMSIPAQRRFRMKSARANYFLRDLLDADLEVRGDVVSSRIVSTVFPWDWCSFADRDVIVDCADKNIHFKTKCEGEVCFRAGLPTQVDRLANAFVFGSCYSNGWTTSDDLGGSLQFHDHGMPVLLVAEHGDDVYGVDAQGSLFVVNVGRSVTSVTSVSLGRARMIGGCVYLLDWARPREVVRIELDGFRKEVIDISPVIVANDICKVNDRFYLVDKLQGRIFSFDERFQFIESCMGFGKAPGRLYDPIALRVHNGNIAVLSWLTGALATIRPF